METHDSANRFGVLTFLPWNHDWNFKFYAGHRVETAVDLIHEVGVGFVRMDFLWDDIEPKRPICFR
jgi:hypothetical protein